jgi:hypothetical protein
MDMSAETVLAVVTGLGGVLSGAVAKMWVAFTAELKDCKEDRNNLHKKVDGLHETTVNVAAKLGRLEGLLGRKEDKQDNTRDSM